MAERGDLTVLHEPFSNLQDYGETDAGGQTFGSPGPRCQAHRRDVFLKDTMDHQHDAVLADQRFLAGTRGTVSCPLGQGKNAATGPGNGLP
jgi:hypothetical protein